MIRARGTALLAIAAVSVACSQSPSPDASSLDSVEVNDVLIDLPRTMRVTCDAVTTNEYRFAWTGGNILVPHPLDRDIRSSHITLHFLTDPPAVRKARIKLTFHGDALKLNWPNKREANRQSADLSRAGGSSYIFARNLTEPNADVPVYYVRIKFRC